MQFNIQLQIEPHYTMSQSLSVLRNAEVMQNTTDVKWQNKRLTLVALGANLITAAAVSGQRSAVIDQHWSAVGPMLLLLFIIIIIIITIIGHIFRANK